MDKPALCIDLGASFTKIAVRKDANSEAVLLRDTNMMTGGGESDNQFCFPSITAHSISGKQWAFGWETTDYQASNDILILQDWKSVLFHERYLEEYFDPDMDGDIDPVAIFLQKQDPYFIALACAKNYIKWLHDELIPSLLAQNPDLNHFSISDFETRVCVPDFVIDTGAGITIERLMEEAGFDNTDTYCISEPKSSLIGVLTGGRNSLTSDGEINHTAMFGDHRLLDQLSNPDDSVFFLDIGSFTTDMALAGFGDFRSGALAKSPAASIALGIYKLDGMITSQLTDQIVDLNNLPATEQFHRNVYNESKLAQFSGNESISMSDGREIPLPLVETCLENFTKSILSACDMFLHARQGNRKIHAIVLTGGGSLPSRITEKVIKRLEMMDFPLLHAHRNIPKTTIPVESLDTDLVRGASAIGGTSILYSAELTGEYSDHSEADRVKRLFTTAA